MGPRPRYNALVVELLAETFQARSVLDYGAGKRTLGRKLPFPIWEYDPAVPEIAAPPRPSDLVVALETLEHVEPELLSAVLAHLRELTRTVCYVTITTGPARKTLPDGRNAHLIIQPPQWWSAQLSQHFTLIQEWVFGNEYCAVARPR